MEDLKSLIKIQSRHFDFFRIYAASDGDMWFVPFGYKLVKELPNGDVFVERIEFEKVKELFEKNNNK